MTYGNHLPNLSRRQLLTLTADTLAAGPCPRWGRDRPASPHAR